MSSLDFIQTKIEDADMVLIGIGEVLEQTEQMNAFYRQLGKILKGKNYFLLTLSGNDTTDFGDISTDRIVKLYHTINADEAGEEDDSQWNRYTSWLSGTLNKKLCIIELDTGFHYPTVLRWPFEKVVSLNRKANLIRVNNTMPQIPQEIADKCTSVKEDSVSFICELAERY
jgi:hypothetical protein